MPSKAIILLSGGLDSATVLAIAQKEGHELYTMTFSYGQRHNIEVEKARELAALFHVKEHKVIHIDLRAFGGSSLTANLDVPKDRTERAMHDSIPITYVPARNTIFLSYALAYAEVIQARKIYIGVNAVDYSGYPDCRPEYIEAFNRVALLGTKAGIEGEPILIETPIIQLTKKEIIQRGLSLGLDYSQTHSCYDPSPQGLACGHCDSCLIRQKAFGEAGIPDPTRYSEDK